MSRKVIICKEDEEINQKTRRCRKKCKDDEERNEKTGRCRKKPYRKSKKIASRKISSRKPIVCKEDEEINPKTGRCRKKCKDDEERNEKTGRCRKINDERQLLEAEYRRNYQIERRERRRMFENEIEDYDEQTRRNSEDLFLKYEQKMDEENEAQMIPWINNVIEEKRRAKKDEQKCDLSWLDRPYKCSKKTKEEVEQYANDCNLDIKLFKTKTDRCRELYKKQNPKKIREDAFKIVEFKPYSEEKDLFYNQEKIKLKNIDTKNLHIPLFRQYESDYEYLYVCILFNDVKSFKEFIEKHTETNIFFYPLGSKPLLEVALQYKTQEIVDIIYDLEMKHRNKGKSTCYKVYSEKYFKLLESLSTYEKPVDFYIEEWLFNENYKKAYYKLREKTPIQILYLENCFWNRKNRYNEECLYPNIRWQSGDPRKINISEKLKFSITNVIEAFLSDGNLYLEEFNNTFKEAIPFLELLINGRDFDIKKFIENNVLFKKEFDKHSNKDLFLTALQKYVSNILITKSTNYIEYFINKSNNNDFPKFKKGIPPEGTFKYNFSKLLDQKKTPKNIVEYNFCKRLSHLITQIIIATSFILDVYTILRIFKETDVKPYFVYCYFGDDHTRNLLNFFTNILGWYKIIINKPENDCKEQSITPDKNCRCISFEPNEYVENSKEIRQLSGPISFYKLEAINKDTRPYYINLFGDRHNSERGQCKECNFDYIEYYRHTFADKLNN
jgi:hypothetical protein